MQIDKNQVLDLLRSRGDDQSLRQADQELPQQVVTEQHAGLLDTFGLNPHDIVAELAEVAALVECSVADRDRDRAGWVGNAAAPRDPANELGTGAHRAQVFWPAGARDRPNPTPRRSARPELGPHHDLWVPIHLLTAARRQA